MVGQPRSVRAVGLSKRHSSLTQFASPQQRLPIRCRLISPRLLIVPPPAVRELQLNFNYRQALP